MRTRAAVLWELGGSWSVEEVELDPPRRSEVLVRLAASGLCHSDEHVVQGDLMVDLPVIGGHEGAGVVEEVGPGAEWLEPGDHVIFGFIPSCGRCAPCASGHGNLCELGRFLAAGRQVSDHTARHHARGQDLGLMCMLGTFAEHTVVNEASCIKIPSDFPLDKACLLGCGVVTGWGSSVYAAEVKPGEDVAVVGIGGIGINAVQGAAMAGARRVFAVDPVEFKRQQAMAFGATHVAASLDEALGQIREVTYGRMADKVIMCMGVGRGDSIGPALAITANRGRVVVTNVHPQAETSVAMSAWDLCLTEKQVVGSLFGSTSPRAAIPKLMALYTEGRLKLDELITRRYKLDEVNAGYQDMLQGRNLRGILELSR